MGLQGRQDLKDLQEELQEAQKALDDFREQLHRERHLREEISIELKERDENLHEVREALKKTRVELQEEKNLQDFMSQELQKRNEHLEKSQQPLEQQHEATVTTLKKRNEQLSRARNARDKWKKVAEEHIFADSQAVFERCLYQAGAYLELPPLIDDRPARLRTQPTSTTFVLTTCSTKCLAILSQ
jgi:DNA repair exonuclease SbcCD ATPase subunit